MSKIINTIEAITLSLSIGVAGANAKEYRSINERQKNQQERIAQGIKSGDLTKKEAVNLEKQQIHIAKTEKRMRADDGGLSLKAVSYTHLDVYKRQVLTSVDSTRMPACAPHFGFNCF